ncbi:MAG: MBL fold metallo-hydrolase [Verrucomicrobiota bacterium]|nr:MBL fold metallo-hydrolase [Verrucomicrobiota bacterium]
MNFEVISVGILEVNCFIVQPNKNKQDVYIIDPGGDDRKIIDFISDRKWDPKAILLTHSHVDHIGAVPRIADEYSIPVYLNGGDKPMYFSKENALSPYLDAVKNLPEPLPFSKLEIAELSIIETPGHSPGGVCFYFADSATLFSGDTLFCNSIGRTDLPGGDMNILLNSIQTRLLNLPENTVVYPGHGSSTTIKSEKRNNPFLQGS